MALGILVLLTALIISAVAIYYSVAGLAAIFASAVIPIVIMGTALEAGKLVTAVWLHTHWNRAAWWLKLYLSSAVLVLMFVTSMGIFGFLSKAHTEQTSIAGDNSLQVQVIDQRIQREQKRIQDTDLVIGQLDQSVQTLLDANRIRGTTGAIATRESQREERDALNNIINQAQLSVAQLQEQKLVLQQQQVAIEAEVGPIKYIAEFVYGEKADKDLLEEAVRWVIIVLIIVFDPLALALLIAAQYTFKWHREHKAEGDSLNTESGSNIVAEPTVTTTPWPFVAAVSPEIHNVPTDRTAPEPVEDTGQPTRHEPSFAVQSQPLSNDDLLGDQSRNEDVHGSVGTDDEVEQLQEHPESVTAQPAEKKDIESLVESKRLTEAELEELDQDDDWKEAKHIWKEAHPDETLKHQKELYLSGVIDDLPWAADVKKKKYIVKENTVQIQKTTQD